MIVYRVLNQTAYGGSYLYFGSITAALRAGGTVERLDVRVKAEHLRLLNEEA